MIIYGAIAAGIVIAALSGALWVQTERLDVAQGTLKNCSKAREITDSLLFQQNKAVDDLAKDSEKRARNAAAALAKAREGQGKQDSEIARLRGLSAAGLDCAGAVAEVKLGMRP